jgi:hypothetical protein
MVSASHKWFGGGVKSLMDRLQQLSSQKVCVGVPESDDESADPNYKGSNERKNGKSEEDSDSISNADLVYIHTHGVRPRLVRGEMQKDINKGQKYSVALQMYIHEHGSFAYQVPARPIIEPAIEDSKKHIAELLGFAAQVAMGGKDIRKALLDVGQEAQQDVQNWFTNPQNGWAANSPTTVKAKGSDKPLIDTGALRDAITFVIRGEDDD